MSKDNAKTKSIFSQIIIFLFLITILFLGYFLFINKNEPAQTLGSVSYIKPTQTEEKRPIPDGFILFEEDQFYFYYPENWPELEVVYQEIDDSIQLGPYGVAIKYSPNFNQWQVVKTQSWRKEKVDDFYYPQETGAKINDQIIFNIGHTVEDNCGQPSYLFKLDSQIAVLNFPIICNDGENKTFSNSSKIPQYPNIDVYHEVIHSIKPR